MQRLCIALFLVTSSALAQAADAVSQLADLLASARSVEAKFEQTVTAANGVVSQKSQGVMNVARPQLFRWDVKTPFAQLIVADGKQVWVYDPDLAQAIVRPFDKQLADTPALLFSGDAKGIADRYDVTLAEENAAVQRFELKPHDKEALFESLRISFRDHKLNEMLLVDPLGQKTAIAFSDVKLNGKVVTSLFRFSPPKGTDVIREGD